MIELCENVPDNILLMSRKHCHAENVSSIVIGKNNNGQLLRMFLAWPDHRLDQNYLYGKLPVGIHNHRYSLRLKLLAGEVENTIYKRGSGRTLNEFEFCSGQMKGAPVVSKIGKAEICFDSKSWLLTHSWLELKAEDFHDISCCGPAAWLVEEGEVVQNTTVLFSPKEEIETEDLYHTFESTDEVRSHVRKFVEIYENNYY